jgi:AcrR family transcriptional regulator
MDAATELFAERGFEGTRVEHIAELAGVNKAMISYHFGGKKGLYAVILEAAFAVAKDRFRRIRSSSAPADQRLREFIDTFGDLATLRPGLPAMVIREVLSGGMHMDEALLPHFLEMFGLVHEVIDQGVQEGSFRTVDPFLTHLTLFGSLAFFFATLPLGTKFIERGMLPTRVPLPQEYVEHLKEFMVRAVSVDAGSAATPIRRQAT